VWESAFYFSTASYATVGYGDVVLPQMWRTLGPVESIIGVLMCGLSAGFLFAIVSRLIDRESVAPGAPITHTGRKVICQFSAGRSSTHDSPWGHSIKS
jgi:Ion channel